MNCAALSMRIIDFPETALVLWLETEIQKARMSRCRRPVWGRPLPQNVVHRSERCHAGDAVCTGIPTRSRRGRRSGFAFAVIGYNAAVSARLRKLRTDPAAIIATVDSNIIRAEFKGRPKDTFPLDRRDVGMCEEGRASSRDKMKNGSVANIVMI